MKSFLKKINQKIPQGIRKAYMPLVYAWSYRLQKIFNLIYPSVIVFEGLEKHSQAPLNFVYAGFHSLISNYWSEAILSDGFRKYVLGRCFFWDIRSFLKRRDVKCSFMLMEHNELTLKNLNSNPGFRVPYWISMEIDISIPLEELLGRQKADAQRRIRKNGLSFEITHDAKCFDDFFHNMFMPYIQGRHADTALLDTQENLFKIFSKGALILIKREGQILAGGLIEFDNEKVSFRRLGVRDAKWEYVQLGVLGAIYYFLTVEMKKRGYSRLHIGGTRPLLSDGITKYKSSLKAKLEPKNKHSCLWMTFLNDSASVRSFLINNPFIFINKEKKPCRAVFATAGQGISPEGIENILHSCPCEGLAETYLFIFNNNKGASNKINYAILPDVFVRFIENVMESGDVEISGGISSGINIT